MDTVIKQIELIERIDQLIRLQATGPPAALASRLGISRTKVYRAIDVMKELNAPIIYKIGLQSFIYEKEVKFRFGFVAKDLGYDDLRSIHGGSLIGKKQCLQQRPEKWYGSFVVL
ncbi:helix-turn-helix domain-containing protein [Aquimarina sp. D1M17]|uniref:HTH domain-containing protein n=1 Tax=Aquimarina acroporae TaxID=2937283 RepID=UPI0020BF5C7F|nr:HTH domain-containing protein [Aquimarina acroporae]MCK8524421.1 helix-turn-helix domain-containing protein [Aquimarina acroporae]